MIARPPRIYGIADAATVGLARLDTVVAEMADAGVRWIQIRAKMPAGPPPPDDRLYRTLDRCLASLAGFDVSLWINDRVDLAALLPFAGLHLGQDDLPPRSARELIGERAWIGRSTHTPDQVREADRDPAVDMVAFGPVFSTRSKKGSGAAVGLRGLRGARESTRKPLVAIGGIDETTIADVLDAGADSVAMIGAICRGDVGANCRRLEQAAKGARV